MPQQSVARFFLLLCFTREDTVLRLFLLLSLSLSLFWFSPCFLWGRDGLVGGEGENSVMWFKILALKHVKMF